jgi:hypothetical protein
MKKEALPFKGGVTLWGEMRKILLFVFSVFEVTLWGIKWSVTLNNATASQVR